MGSPSVYCNNNDWEVLCPVGTCLLAEAEEGQNTVGQAQVTTCGLSPIPWYCLTSVNVMKLPCLWKSNRQPHPFTHSVLFIEVIAHWGWPDRGLVSTTLCSSKRVCIWDATQQQGAVLGSCACKSRYPMAAVGVSGNPCAASGDICRHPGTAFAFVTWPGYRSQGESAFSC